MQLLAAVHDTPFRVAWLATAAAGTGAPGLPAALAGTLTSISPATVSRAANTHQRNMKKAVSPSFLTISPQMIPAQNNRSTLNFPRQAGPLVGDRPLMSDSGFAVRQTR
jgi:hypothetical protein